MVILENEHIQKETNIYKNKHTSGTNFSLKLRSKGIVTGPEVSELMFLEYYFGFPHRLRLLGIIELTLFKLGP